MASHFWSFSFSLVVVELVVYALHWKEEGGAFLAGESRQETTLTLFCYFSLEFAIVADYGQLQKDATINCHSEGVAEYR